MLHLSYGEYLLENDQLFLVFSTLISAGQSKARKMLVSFWRTSSYIATLFQLPDKNFLPNVIGILKTSLGRVTVSKSVGLT